MFNRHRIGALLLMGGIGRRFGSTMPKQFHRLAGKPVYRHTLEIFLKVGYFDEIILCCHPDWIRNIEQESLPLSVQIVQAGNTRQESSFLGLISFKKPPDFVVIHDSVRPFVSEKILRQNIESAISYGAVNTCIASQDTIVHAPQITEISSIPQRSHYLRGQTPQSFAYSLITQAHRQTNHTNATDDCQLILEMGHPVSIVMGDEYNVKITSELDLFLAEHLLRRSLASCELLQEESLRNKIFAVIGGTGGIGQSICEKLQREKARVISLSRTTIPLSIDLQDVLSIQKTFESITKLHGPLDGLINCAGILLVRPLHDLSEDEIDALINVNFRGLVLSCLKAPLKKGSHVINLASSAFSRGRKNSGLYSATKAAVVNFTQALAEERPDLHIHTVIPQRTRTSMRTQNFPGENSYELLTPDEVALAVLKLLKDPISTGMLVEVKKNWT